LDLSSLSFGRKEKAIMDGIMNHFAVVKSAVVAFADLVQAVAAKGPNAQELLEKVFDAESRADGIHREVSVKIAEGAFFGGVREDFLALMESVDSIADSAKDSGRLLMIGRLADPIGPEVLGSQDMKDFVAHLQDAVSALEDLLAAFKVSKQAVLSRVHNVEKFEEMADANKNALLKQLFEIRDRVDAVSIIQTRDFLFAADDIADNAEDASDEILVLVAKGYG
jgi:predicted phosphate transport protein (TIGR00153 family)